MLPDPGCYEERYRLTAGAAPTLGASLIMVGLLFRTEALWTAGVVIAVALAIVLGPAMAARRRVAFRADYAGLTFGPAPGALMVRRGRPVFIPWGEVDKIVLHPDDPGIAGRFRAGRAGRGPAAGSGGRDDTRGQRLAAEPGAPHLRHRGGRAGHRRGRGPARRRRTAPDLAFPGWLVGRELGRIGLGVVG